MGREKSFHYCYDGEFYEMIPSTLSNASLQDIQWSTNFASSASITGREENNSGLWNDDFGHRPSWCDAKLALQQIKNGNAAGNKVALYLRAFLQSLLFRLGCLIQKHSLVVLVVGLIILASFSAGLLNATIETDLEKLWVEKKGRLSEERTYLASAFKLPDSQSVAQNYSKNADKSGQLLGGSGSEQFLMLIQTPRHLNAKIGVDDLLLHEVTLSSVAQLEIRLFNETWSLRDICFRPIAPSLPEYLKKIVGELLEETIPCLIITPLDCFWEGSKPIGPFPPLEIDGLLLLLESFTTNHITWKNLDPQKILDEVTQIVSGPAIQSVHSLFHRAGISHAYTRRPCLEPLDPECPKTAPNYADLCQIVKAVLDFNGEHGNVLNFLEGYVVNGTQATTPFEPFEPMSDCEIYGEKVRRLLLNNKEMYKKFMPSKSMVNVNQRLSSGCKGFAENYMRWPDDLIIGGVKRVGRDISSFEALESVFMLASSNDVFQRTNLSHKANLDQPWSPDAATQVLAAWQRHFTNFIYNHKKNSGGLRILHPLAGTSVSDMLKQFSKFNPTVIIVGYLFMIFYASLSLCSFADKGIRSGVGLGLSGCLLVTLAGMAGLGCSMLLDIPFNAATTQIVPFLTLGLGVDDMFLLVHSYRDVVKLAKRDEIGFLLKETGLSALLTSINNILSFLAGGLMPVPALRDFCLQVALLLCFNAISILTIYPAIMSFDLKRRKSRRMDILCCIQASAAKTLLPAEKLQTELKDRATSDVAAVDRYATISLSRSATNDGYSHSRTHSEVTCPPGADIIDLSIGARTTSRSFLTSPVEMSGGASPIDEGGRVVGVAAVDSATNDSSAAYDCTPSHWTLHRFVNDYYNVWLSKISVKIGVLCVNLVVLIFGIMYCSKVVLGLELADVIPKGTAAHAFLEARETFFSFYPFNAIIKGPIDLPNKQTLMREYRQALSDVEYVVKREDRVQEQFWLDLMREWLKNLQKHLDEDLISGKISYDSSSGAGVNNDASGESLLAFQLLCNAGYALDCNRVNNTRLVDDDGLIERYGFYNYLTAWVNLDPMTYYVSRAAMHPKPVKWYRSFDINKTALLTVPPAQNLTFSRIPFYLNGLVDTPTIVHMIEMVRKVSEEYSTKGLPNFPEGIPFTFWEQYLSLRWNLFTALLIVIGSVFVVISILLVCPWTSAIVAFVLVVLVVELAGFMGAFGLKLNAVSAVSLITAVGIGVEFTVHLSLSFLTTLGSRNQRMVATLNHMFIPVLHGGLSTLLGVIMLAFSQFEFIVRYFFMVLSTLIMLGLLNGLALLPVLLSLIGPRSEVRTIDGSHYLPPPPSSSPGQQKASNKNDAF